MNKEILKVRTFPSFTYGNLKNFWFLKERRQAQPSVAVLITVEFSTTFSTARSEIPKE